MSRDLVVAKRLGDDRGGSTGGYSQRRLAERVGTSQATVSKRLALLNLPEAAQLSVRGAVSH